MKQILTIPIDLYRRSSSNPPGAYLFFGFFMGASWRGKGLSEGVGLKNLIVFDIIPFEIFMPINCFSILQIQVIRYFRTQIRFFVKLMAACSFVTS